MAGIDISLVTAEVALTAATAKTVVQALAPTNQRLRVVGWGVAFDGSSPAAEPVLVELLRQTTAGTMSALTPVRKGVGSETIQTTGQHTATVEPTAGDVLERRDVHPQSGYQEVFPFGREILVAGSGRIGIRCTAPAGVNCVAWLDLEE